MNLMTGKKPPSDVLTVIGLLILTDIFVLTSGLSETSFRSITGLFLVLFLPGYSLVAALFPAKSDLDWIERVALSFGMSIAVVPLIGLGLNYTPWGIRPLPVLMSLSVFILIMCGIAYLKRAKLSETEAFEVPFRETAVSLKAELMEIKAGIMGKSELELDRVLNVILVLSILLSVGTLIYVIMTPKQGEHFTEFYILGPEGKANNYTTEYVLGEKGTVTVGIINQEYRPVNYTMELRLENRSLPLPEKQKHIRLAHNETWENPVTFSPPFEGKNMKLEFLLFNENSGSVPYRALHLWIDVNTNKANETRPNETKANVTKTNETLNTPRPE
jgi:uncharacterized membrane protein